MFYPHLIGSKGFTKNRLEKETKTQIKIPKKGEDSETIEVLGPSCKDVIACRRRIDLIVMGAKKKMDFTHFISVPFNSKEITENFQKFMKEIVEDPNITVDPKAFQKPAKLHQTVLPIVLLDNEDRAKAAQCLTDCKEMIINPFFQNRSKSLKLKLAGVEIMNDDPSIVNVLFAKIESQEFQQLCNEIMDFFVKKGLITKQYDNVKMHVTLINTKYQNSHLDRQKQKNFFDARKILENYKNFHFGTIDLKEIHLSQRHTEAANGYYEASAILEI